MVMPKGKKFGGRAKGTPNKDKAVLLARALELGMDPFETLIHFANGNWKQLGYENGLKCVGIGADGKPIFVPLINPDMRINCARAACEYVHPKLKSLELKANDIPLRGFIFLGDNDQPVKDQASELDPASKTDPAIKKPI